MLEYMYSAGKTTDNLGLSLQDSTWLQEDQQPSVPPVEKDSQLQGEQPTMTKQLCSEALNEHTALDTHSVGCIFNFKN